MKPFLSFLWNTLLRLQRIVMLLSIVLTLAAVFSEIIARYILKSPFVGIEELAAYCAFWLYFIGGSYGAYERSHISADISSVVLKDRIKYARFHTCVSLLTTLIAAYAVPWAYEYFMWGWEMNEQSRATFGGSSYPVVYFQAAIPVGLALMTFYFFAEFCQWFKCGFIDRAVPDEMMSARGEIDSWI